MRLFEFFNLSEARVGEDRRPFLKTLLHYLELPNGGDYYITFSTIDKVGIFPKSDYTTPNGVYTYRLFDFKGDILKRANHVKSSNRDALLVFPYAADRDYAFILQDTSINKLVLTDDMGISKLNELTAKLIHIINNVTGNDAQSEITERLARIYEAENNNYALYATIEYMLTYDVSLSKKGKNRTNLFNSILRKLGFDMVYDPNRGYIHVNEPSQAVFLVPSAYKMVDKIYMPSFEGAVKNSNFRDDNLTNKEVQDILDNPCAFYDRLLPDKLQFMIVKRDPLDIEYIKDPDPRVCAYVAGKIPIEKSIEYGKGIGVSHKDLVNYMSNNPKEVLYIKYQLPDSALYAAFSAADGDYKIEKNCFIKMKSENYKLKAIEMSPQVIQELDNPTEEMQITAVSVSSQMIAYISVPSLTVNTILAAFNAYDPEFDDYHPIRYLKRINYPLTKEIIDAAKRTGG